MWNGGIALAIEAIKKVNVSEEVFLNLKDMIINKEWLPGEKLPSESALSESYDVSRVTIRNALQKLKALGLIETHLGSGSFVKDFSETGAMNSLIPIAFLGSDIDSILEFRREIESGTCAIAAEKATDEDVFVLRSMIAEMENIGDDLEKLALADQKFHYQIAHISRNPLILKTYEIISEVYSAHMKNIVSVMGGRRAMSYHLDIVNAIAAHDAKLARECMIKHMNMNIEYINRNR